MGDQRVLSADDIGRRRMAAQHLHRPRRRKAADLVRRLLGVQSQVLSAAGLALRARTDGLTAAAIDRARLRDRSIVLSWAMRGTLHLVAADDYGWLQPLVTEPGIANAYRRLKQLAVPAGQPDRAVKLIERMLESEGPLIRSEIAERLRRLGIHTDGQAIAHLIWLAAARGVLCYGPDRGREQCFVLVRDWLGKPERRDRDASLTELALRYLKGHGPATPIDLAGWSGIRLSDARRAWGSIQGRLVGMDTAHGQMWVLRSSRETAPPGLIRLLPTFDEYVLGWKERDLIAAAEHVKKINRGGGWLHPVVLYDGRAAATWSAARSPKALTIRVNPFAPLTPVVRRGIAVEAEAVAAFYDTRVVVSIT
jgi:hypothetical protein